MSAARTNIHSVRVLLPLFYLAQALRDSGLPFAINIRENKAKQRLNLEVRFCNNKATPN